jgi:hypothetical protein
MKRIKEKESDNQTKSRFSVFANCRFTHKWRKIIQKYRINEE